MSWHGGAVVSTAASQQEGQEFSSVLPQYKNMQVRRIGNSELTVGVSARALGCLFLWPSNKLATCPGFNPAFTREQLWWKMDGQILSKKCKTQSVNFKVCIQWFICTTFLMWTKQSVIQETSLLLKNTILIEHIRTCCVHTSFRHHSPIWGLTSQKIVLLLLITQCCKLCHHCVCCVQTSRYICEYHARLKCGVYFDVRNASECAKGILGLFHTSKDFLKLFFLCVRLDKDTECFREPNVTEMSSVMCLAGAMHSKQRLYVRSTRPEQPIVRQRWKTKVTFHWTFFLFTFQTLFKINPNNSNKVALKFTSHCVWKLQGSQVTVLPECV